MIKKIFPLFVCFACIYSQNTFCERKISPQDNTDARKMSLDKVPLDKDGTPIGWKKGIESMWPSEKDKKSAANLSEEELKSIINEAKNIFQDIWIPSSNQNGFKYVRKYTLGPHKIAFQDLLRCVEYEKNGYNIVISSILTDASKGSVDIKIENNNGILNDKDITSPEQYIKEFWKIFLRQNLWTTGKEGQSEFYFKFKKNIFHVCYIPRDENKYYYVYLYANNKFAVLQYTTMDMMKPIPINKLWRKTN